MPCEKQPIFVLSTQRSGSTLLQRILGSHAQIHTVSEPHILLPLLYSTNANGTYTEYGHNVCAAAINDFCQELPHKQDDYRAAIRNFAMELYSKVTPEDGRYFLDKTPRYSLVADQIPLIFPDGKFIFLFRNPLAVIASMMETFKGGRWCLYAYNADLFVGLPRLIATCDALGGGSHPVRYEDLVSGEEPPWLALFDYLGLPFDANLTTGFGKVSLKGLGDPTGSKAYKAISREPLDKWRRVLANPLRRAWCRGYLEWLGEDRLAIMGYDLKQLLAELDALPVSFRWLFSDLFLIPYGWLYRCLEPKLLLKKLRSLSSWHDVHTHY